MNAQHHRRDLKLPDAVGGETLQVFGRQLRSRVPVSPSLEVTLAGRRERLEQARERERGSRFGARAEGEPDRTRPGQLAEQRHVAGTRRAVLPRHGAVSREILPSVAGPRVAGARTAQGVALRPIDSRECQCEWALPGLQDAPAVVIADLGIVVSARAAEVRRKQRIRAQLRVSGEPDVDQHRVAFRPRHDGERQLEASVAMDDVDRRNAGLEEVDRVLPEPLDLHPKALAIGHQETEVADLRNVYSRIVDFVQDPAADGEPESRAARGTADHLFVAGAPGGLQAGAARRRAAARELKAPGRREPRPRASRAEHRDVGIHDETGRNGLDERRQPALVLEALAKRALHQKCLGLLRDATGDVHPAARAVGEREIAGHGAEHREEHRQRRPAGRVLAGACRDVGGRERLRRAPRQLLEDLVKRLEAAAQQDALHGHAAACSFRMSCKTASSWASLGANPMWPPSVPWALNDRGRARDRTRRIRCPAREW